MPYLYYPFEPEPLLYSYSALEPYIDTETMRVHHSRLLQGYVDHLNETLANSPELQRQSITQLLKDPMTLPNDLRQSIINYGGGVYNHNFFFASLKPGSEENAPSGYLAQAIEQRFGSFDDFQKIFKDMAMDVFGSGWLWLVKNHNGRLYLVQTANQDSPISQGWQPLIGIDLWEHAYFLQYLNLREEYIDNWFKVIDWERADKMYRTY